MKINKQKILSFVIITYFILSFAWIANDITRKKHPCEEARDNVEDAMEEIRSILGL